MSDKNNILAIDLGGTSIKFAWYSEDLHCLETWKVPTHGLRRHDLFEHLLNSIGTVIKKNSRPLQGIGLACAGSVNSTRGIVIASDNIQWYQLPVAAMLEHEFHCPVHVLNDCEAAMLAEIYCLEREQKMRIQNALFLTLGTGVGGAVYLNGQSYRGAHAQGAELGHIITHASGRACSCGNQGCLEQYLSASALQETINMACAQNPSLMFSDIAGLFDACEENDPTAQTILKDYAREFAIAFVSLAAIFDPEYLIVGGGLSHYASQLRSFFDAALKDCASYQDYYHLTEWNFASQLNQAGVLGAALNFQSHAQILN